METRESVAAVEGQGLEGDRYLSGVGTYSNKPGIDRQVTLIEAEVLESLSAELGQPFSSADSRRNVITRGLQLNDLTESTFRVGEVTLRGVRLCEPCAYLEEVTGLPVLKPLVNRGGLRAEILTGGTIRVGDPLEV